MITLIDGGHWQEKGYYYRVYLTFPEIKCETIVNLYNREHKVKKFNANTSFWLISNSIYVNIGFSILGFGLGFEVQSKE